MPQMKAALHVLKTLDNIVCNHQTNKMHQFLIKQYQSQATQPNTILRLQ